MITVTKEYHEIPAIDRILVNKGDVTVEFKLGSEWIKSETFATGARIVYFGTGTFRIVPSAGAGYNIQ